MPFKRTHSSGDWWWIRFESDCLWRSCWVLKSIYGVYWARRGCCHNGLRFANSYALKIGHYNQSQIWIFLKRGTPYLVYGTPNSSFLILCFRQLKPLKNFKKFYKKSFLTANIVDRCINCHKHNTIQVIVRIEIDSQVQQGPFCRSCYLDFTGLIKYFKL